LNVGQSEYGVALGSVLSGKYRTERVLGAGGMGVVVLAHHLQLDTRVAIKLLLPAMASNPDIVARFTREARAAVRITSEHVARVFDVGVLESGAPYMVMEFLEGIDLEAWLRTRGPLPVEQAVEFVLQACVAIAEAHVLRIIHRDLKPANLFCVRRADGQLVVKVLDFGISKIGEGAMAGSRGTKTHASMGSPLYMSPEQMRSAKDVGPEADVWALSVVLYELLTGRPPFDGETLPEVCLKIANDPAPLLRAAIPRAPQRLEALIAKGLEKDHRSRFPRIADFAQALVEVCPTPRTIALGERIAGFAPGPPSASFSPAPATTSGTLSQFGRTDSSQPSRQRATVITALGLAVGAAILGIAMLTRSRVAPAQSTAPLASQPSAPQSPAPPIVALAPSVGASIAPSASESAAPPVAFSAPVPSSPTMVSSPPRPSGLAGSPPHGAASAARAARPAPNASKPAPTLSSDVYDHM
jgi:eukaryotic-like serine/threonine-protein kinase